MHHDSFPDVNMNHYGARNVEDQEGDPEANAVPFKIPFSPVECVISPDKLSADSKLTVIATVGLFRTSATSQRLMCIHYIITTTVRVVGGLYHHLEQTTVCLQEMGTNF